MGRWFVNQGDALRANVISSIATALTVFVTILTPDGEFRRVRSNVPFTSNGTRVPETAVELISTLPEGEVLSLNVATFTANIKRGQCYVQIYVIEQPTMAQGYVFAGFDVLLGDSVDPGPAGGPGFVNKISLGDPAAGVNYTLQAVPTNAMWRLKGFFGTLVTGAGVANREHAIYVDDGTNAVAGSVSPEIQTATLTIDYFAAEPTVASGVGASLAAGAIGMGVPTVPAPEGWRFNFVTYSLQAGDNWGPGFIVVEEWLVL